jgi:hypothetical protein
MEKRLKLCVFDVCKYCRQSGADAASFFPKERLIDHSLRLTRRALTIIHVSNPSLPRSHGIGMSSFELIHVYLYTHVVGREVRVNKQIKKDCVLCSSRTMLHSRLCRVPSTKHVVQSALMFGSFCMA